MTEGANAVGVSINSVQQCVAGRIRYSRGYEFERVHQLVIMEGEEWRSVMLDGVLVQQGQSLTRAVFLSLDIDLLMSKEKCDLFIVLYVWLFMISHHHLLILM